MSWIAAGVMAPAHATVDSILAKLRIPATSCLTTWALASVTMRPPITVNTASVGKLRCIRTSFAGCSLARAFRRTHARACLLLFSLELPADLAARTGHGVDVDIGVSRAHGDSQIAQVIDDMRTGRSCGRRHDVGIG